MKFNQITIFLILIFLLLLSSFFRFNNLKNWGLFLYDEGQYISEAKYLKNVINWSTTELFKIPFTKEKAYAVENAVKNFPDSKIQFRTARPLHTVILSTGFLFSNHINSGNFLIAIFGLLTIIATYYLSLVITKSIKISLLSAALLSFNPLHIFYSRSNLAEVDSTFFFVVSLIFLILLIQKNNLKFLVLSSLFLSFSYLTNNNRFAFYTPFLLLIIHLFNINPINSKKNLIDATKQIAKKLFLFISIFIIPLIIFEIPYYLAYLLTHNLGIIVTNPTYIEQLLWLYTRLLSFGSNLSLYSLLSYPYIFLSFFGLTFTVIFLFGIWAFIKERKKHPLISIMPIFITLIFSSIHTLQPPRAISPIIPLLSIVTSVGIFYLSDKFGKYNLVLITIISFLLFSEFIYKDINFLNYNTNFQEAINFMQKNNISKITTTADSTITAYDNHIDTRNYMNLAYDNFNRENILNEYRYFLTNNQKYTINTNAQGLSKNVDPTLESIEIKCVPIFQKPDNQNEFFMKLFILEHNFSILNTWKFKSDFDIKNDSFIKIYDYKICHDKLKLVN